MAVFAKWWTRRVAREKDSRPRWALRWWSTLFRHRGTNGSFDGYAHGDGIMWRNDHETRMNHAKVLDGLSNTFLLGEDLPEENRWCAWPYVTHVYGTCAIPPNFIFEEDPGWWPNTASFRSSHGGGLFFATADGTVRFVEERIDMDVYRALATRAGAEVGYSRRVGLPGGLLVIRATFGESGPTWGNVVAEGKAE